MSESYKDYTLHDHEKEERNADNSLIDDEMFTKHIKNEIPSSGPTLLSNILDTIAITGYLGLCGLLISKIFV